MGTYMHGYLELDNERLDKALALIRADQDGVGPYADSWCTQTRGGGYSRHLFFGCTLRESALDAFRARVSRIASEASSRDGDVTDCPEGLFRAAHEDATVPVEIWHVSGGSLRVEPVGASQPAGAAMVATGHGLDALRYPVRHAAHRRPDRICITKGRPPR